MANIGNQPTKNIYQQLLQVSSSGEISDVTGSGFGVYFDRSGNITAQTYTVSSSVTNVQFQQQSGSTIFGDSSDDTHAFTGSLDITGNVSASGNISGSYSGKLQTGLLQIGDAGSSNLQRTANSNGTYFSANLHNTSFGGGYISFVESTTNWGESAIQHHADTIGWTGAPYNTGATATTFRLHGPTAAPRMFSFGFGGAASLPIRKPLSATNPFSSSWNTVNTGQVGQGGINTSLAMLHITNSLATTYSATHGMYSSASKNIIQVEADGSEIFHLSASGDLRLSGDISSSGTLISNEINTIGHITASGNISSSTTSTASFGYIILEGSGPLSSGLGINEPPGTGGSYKLNVLAGNNWNHPAARFAYDNSVYLEIQNTGINVVGRDFKLKKEDSEKLRLQDGGIKATGHITASGDISSSGNLIGNHITASGNISSSGNLIGNQITASGDISSSGNLIGNQITASGDVKFQNMSWEKGHTDQYGVYATRPAGSGFFIKSDGGYGMVGITPNSVFKGLGIRTGMVDYRLFITGSEKGNVTIAIPNAENNPDVKSQLQIAGDIWTSGSNGHITASGNISQSSNMTASFGRIHADVWNDGRGTIYNVCLGDHSGRETNGTANVAIGYNALDISQGAQYSVAVGYQAMGFSGDSGTARFQTGIGYRALYSNSTGDYNVAVGSNAGIWLSGNRNTIIGDEIQFIYTGAGANESVFLGYNAGCTTEWDTNSNSTGSIYIGAYSSASSGQTDNEIVIGSGSIGRGSNTTTIGSSQTVSTYLEGHITASGDISGSATSTGSFGQLSLKHLPITDPLITGSLWVSGSSTDENGKKAGFLMVSGIHG
jgi:hypothetical protein